MKKVSLVQAKANEPVKILGVLGGSNLEHRLLNMGVYTGKEVTKLSHIGLRGPIVIKAGRSILALGHGVAAKIIVGK